jgi:hypothetical protein
MADDAPASTRYGARGRPMSNVDLVEDLCQVSVPLRELRRVHLATYGTLIPHVFMSDVLKHIGQCIGAASRDTWPAPPEAQHLLDVLESGMAYGDRETRNVIAISFTRDSELETFFREMLPMLGPRTRAQLQGR